MPAQFINDFMQNLDSIENFGYMAFANYERRSRNQKNLAENRSEDCFCQANEISTKNARSAHSRQDFFVANEAALHFYIISPMIDVKFIAYRFRPFRPSSVQRELETVEM